MYGQLWSRTETKHSNITKLRTSNPQLCIQMFARLFIRMHFTRVNYKMASDGSTALGTAGVPGKKVSDIWDYYQKIDDWKKALCNIYLPV